MRKPALEPKKAFFVWSLVEGGLPIDKRLPYLGLWSSKSMLSPPWASWSLKTPFLILSFSQVCMKLGRTRCVANNLSASIFCKAALLGDYLPWALEFQYAWILVCVEILFFLWKKHNQDILVRKNLPDLSHGMTAFDLCELVLAYYSECTWRRPIWSKCYSSTVRPPTTWARNHLAFNQPVSTLAAWWW